MSTLDDRQSDTFKSLVSLATEGLKALQLLNGGAVVALLTYLGTSTRAERVELAQAVTWPLRLFVSGLVVATLGYLSTYLTQWALYNEDGGHPPPIKHRFWQWATMGIGIASLILFSEGALKSINAFAK